MTFVRRTLEFAHRWLGVGLALLLSVWFLSGMVMLYRGYPEVKWADRLQRLPTLDPHTISVRPEDAFAAKGRPRNLVLTSFDGRPAYVGEGRLVYADDGREQGKVDPLLLDRAAMLWTGLPLQAATKERIDEVDQWTLGAGLRELRPLFKYSWPDGQQVYVHGDLAEVVQYTTRKSRFWAYLGAIPHWLYVPALRTLDAQWLAVMAWSPLVGIVAVLLGFTIAAWMFSPGKRYRHHGTPARLPYVGWKRWHTVLGLAVGVAAVTWSFSGFLSLEAFRIADRLTAWTVPDVPTPQGAFRDWRALADVLRGPALDLSAYGARSPRDAIAAMPDFDVKELEYASFGGRPFYLASNGRGESRWLPIEGEAFDGFAPEEILQRMRSVAGPYVSDLRVMDAYDAYYRDRHGVLPLPVIAVQMADAHDTRYYVDPKTATLVTSYSRREWVNRWLFHGLHSLDLPWLYNHRPLWDIVILALLLGGSMLCATSVVLSWRALARVAAARFPASVPDRFGPAPEALTGEKR